MWGGRESPRVVRGRIGGDSSSEYMHALWTFDFHSKQDLKELLQWTRQIAVERLRMLAGQRDHRLAYAEWSGNDHPDP